MTLRPYIDYFLKSKFLLDCLQISDFMATDSWYLVDWLLKNVLLLTNSVGRTRYPCAKKMKLDPYFTPYIRKSLFKMDQRHKGKS